MINLNHPLVSGAEQTGFGCPIQVEGQLVNGRSFYFRYRRGWASLGVGASVDLAVDDPDEVGMEYGDSLSGVLGDAEIRSLFSQLARLRLGIR